MTSGRSRSSPFATTLALAVLCCSALAACGPAAAPTSAATGASPSSGWGTDAEIRQPGTDLFWLRCPLGQTWRGGACAGNPRAMIWREAGGACPPGYRLPTRQELADLLGGCDADVDDEKAGWCASCRDSDTCGELFGADDGWYWSSSRKLLANAWSAAFHNGRVRWNDASLGAAVRCVR